jgi:hypothetical protein
MTCGTAHAPLRRAPRQLSGERPDSSAESFQAAVRRAPGQLSGELPDSPAESFQAAFRRSPRRSLVCPSWVADFFEPGDGYCKPGDGSCLFEGCPMKPAVCGSFQTAVWDSSRTAVRGASGQLCGELRDSYAESSPGSCLEAPRAPFWSSLGSCAEAFRTAFSDFFLIFF